jgi:uroporphyrinogen-III synthase
MAGSDKPLAGKRIVVTRAPEQSAELLRTLEDLGAEVTMLPVVAFAPPEDWQALDDALRNLKHFDAILFLSRNAVRYFFQRCRELGIQREALGSAARLIAAVGPATAEEAVKKGLRVNVIAQNRTGESLVRELSNQLAGRSVLLPRSDRGDARVPAALRAAGANVTEVIAYRTVAPRQLDPAILARVRRAEVDAIVFASPSAFHNLSDAIGADAVKQVSERVHFAAIGPTTASAIRQSGSRVDIEVSDAASIGISAVAGALTQYFQQRPATAPARSA